MTDPLIVALTKIHARISRLDSAVTAMALASMNPAVLAAFKEDRQFQMAEQEGEFLSEYKALTQEWVDLFEALLAPDPKE